MRGDIVLVSFPFSDASGAKDRPALVVQVDRITSVNLIIVQITSNIGRLAPTRFLIDPRSVVGLGSGLKTISVVNRESIATLHRSRMKRTIGHLLPATMLQVDMCLKAALGLP